MKLLVATALGGGSGHLHTVGTLAAGLRARGHAVDLAVPDLVAAQRHPALADRPLLQVPTLPPEPRARSLARDYAELLLQAGHGDAARLTGALAAWQGLLEATGAAGLVAEHCPLGLLAARLRGMPAIAVGEGFSVPPATTPLLPLQPWPGGTAPDAGAEARILEAFDRAARSFDADGPGTLAELFPPDRSRLLSLPELDHYGVRGEEACAGLMDPGPLADDAVPSFPAGAGPRTLAFRAPTHPGFDDVARLLAASGRPTLLIAPGIDPARAAGLATATLRIVDRQIDVPAALATAARVITHGGHGTTARVLLAGRPCLILPCYLEQALLGHRLAARRLAVQRTRTGTVDELEAAFAELEAPERQSARARFAAAHGDRDGAADLAALAAWLEARLAAPVSGS